MSIYLKELTRTTAEFPRFRVVRKNDSTLMRVISVLLLFNKSFMRSYVTTIGNTMWTPTYWRSYSDETRAALLRHERVHLWQQRRYGMLAYAFLYLFWPVPVLFAARRREFEMEAYAEQMRANSEYFGYAMLEDEAYRDSMIDHFTTGEYCWMWVRRSDVERWYDGVVSSICRVWRSGCFKKISVSDSQ